MTDYYRVSTDFLLGRNTQTDPRPDWLQPLDPKALPAFYETPVYVWDKGWAFVDAVEKLLRFADGETLLISDVQSVSFLPPSYVLPVSPSTAPLLKREFSARKHWTFLYIAKEMKAIRFDRLHQIGDLDKLSLEELQKREAKPFSAGRICL